MGSHSNSTVVARPEHQAAFRSLFVETNLPKLPVEGQFPTWLNGALLRNGPGMFEAGADVLGHQFDGPAMFHRFGFSNGEVNYANRYCRSAMYEYIKEHNSLGHMSFGTELRPEVLQRMQEEQASGAPPAVNPNVTFVELGGEFLATTDASSIPVKIDPATLETKGLMVWDDRLQSEDCAGNRVSQWRMRGSTGHWHLHPIDGSAVNYYSQPGESGRRSSYNFFRVPKGGDKREPIASIPTDEIAMIHAFCVTERYIIVPEAPLRMDESRLQAGLSLAKSFYWREGTPMYLHVIDIQEKKLIRRFEVRPSYVMHTINAYDEGDEIVLDMAVYDDAAHFWELALDPALRPPGGMFTGARAPELRGHAKPYRYRLNMRTGAVSETVMGDVCIELPTLDYAQRNGRPYARFYATGIDNRPASRFYNQLSSFNLETGDFKTYSVDKHYLGEPVFIARPGRSEETDGVLLSVGFDGTNDCSYLLALEPRTLSPLGRAFLPHHVPPGFHGYFVKGAA
jgi:beta,beta-carotene 9',10'-dioxygenase